MILPPGRILAFDSRTIDLATHPASPPELALPEAGLRLFVLRAAARGRAEPAP